jgi:hypothetical protein
MTVQELKEILEMLHDELEIVIEDSNGKHPVTAVSLFINIDEEVKAILE